MAHEQNVREPKGFGARGDSLLPSFGCFNKPVNLNANGRSSPRIRGLHVHPRAWTAVLFLVKRCANE